MTYTRTTWQDFPNVSTPITAARLNNVEEGLTVIETDTGALRVDVDAITNRLVDESVALQAKLNAEVFA